MLINAASLVLGIPPPLLFMSPNQTIIFQGARNTSHSSIFLLIYARYEKGSPSCGREASNSSMGSLIFLWVVGAREGPTKEVKFQLHLARRRAALHLPLPLAWGFGVQSLRKAIKDASVSFGEVRSTSKGMLDFQGLVSGPLEERVWSWLSKEEEPELAPRGRECVQVEIMPAAKAIK